MRLSLFLDMHAIQVRKHWLWASLFNFVFTPIILTCISFFLYLIDQSPKDVFFYYAFICELSVALLAVVWYFAYHRQGYGYLTFALVIGAIQFIKSLPVQVILCSNLWSFITLSISSILHIWWFIISIRLWKVNKQIEGLKKESKMYLQSIYSLRETLDIESLEKASQEISLKWPKYSSATLDEFDQRKNQLESTLEAQ